jgi:hypothetical protein
MLFLGEQLWDAFYNFWYQSLYRFWWIRTGSSSTPDAKPDCVSSAIEERLQLAGPSSDRRILPQSPDLGCVCGKRNTFLFTLAGCRPSPTSAGMRAEGVETLLHPPLIAGGFRVLKTRRPRVRAS